MKIIVLNMLKDLNKSFIQSKLAFVNNAISSCFFFFYLIIDLYFLILAIIAKIINPIVELIMLLEISIKEAKSEMEIHTVAAKSKFRKCSIHLKLYKRFCSHYSTIHFGLFL